MRNRVMLLALSVVALSTVVVALTADRGRLSGQTICLPEPNDCEARLWRRFW